MSVTQQPTFTQPETPVSVAPPSGPLARIVAVALAAGIVVALVLTLVVFAGGTEGVITGSMLASFGFGWAVLAVLASRRTNRPQRWAFVPATVMGATGIALMVSSPDNDTMTALSWVWPPVVAAMATLMFVRMRRSLPGRGRWLLTPVIAVLILASAGATYENVSLAHTNATYAAPGRLFNVGGHSLHLDCRGHGSPTVVLFNGLGEISASWTRISSLVAEDTRVCAFDRAGQGWSTDADHPQDGIEAAQDLHTLLSAAGETGPYVLTGHSTGGAYAMTYASQYPADVAGLVLLDSSSPEQLAKIPAYAGQYAVMRRGLAILPTLARLGIGHAVPASHLPSPAGAQVTALTATARSARNSRDEISVVLDVFAQAQALTTLDGRPLAVVTASDSLEDTGWAGAQNDLAELSTNHVHRTVESTHAGLLEDAGPSAAAAQAITDVIAAVRTGSPLPRQ